MKRGKNISNSPEEKLDRKTVERNRRIHMKGLCLKLTSLVPSHHYRPSKANKVFQDMLSQQDQLDQVATYIKQLKERVDELKAKKAIVVGMNNDSGTSKNNISRDTMMSEFRIPVVELRDLGSCLEVNVITGLKKNFMLSEIISIFYEEGAEVVSTSFSTMGDKVFHTFHAQVAVSRVGIETSRLCWRLQELVSS